MKLSELKAFAPQFPWDAYFAAATLPPTRPRASASSSCRRNRRSRNLPAIFAKTPVPVWRDYLTTRYLHSFAAYLPKKVDDANFAFYGKVLAGNDAAARPRHARRAVCSTTISARRWASSMSPNISRPKQKPKPNCW